MNKRLVIRRDSLPPDQQAAVLVVPAVGSLDNPSSGLAANTSDHALLASTPDVRDGAAIANLLFGIGVVVPLVEAQVLGSAWPTRRLEDNGVHGLADHPLVVDVGPRDRDRQGHASGVGQNVALRAELPTIGGIGAREVPPFGAFTLALSIEHQLKSTPTSWS